MENILTLLDADLPVPTANTTQQEIAVPDVSTQANNNVIQDANEARTNIRLLIAQGTQAITELLSLTRAARTARSYEVLAGMLKTMAELNHDLMKVHENEQKLSDAPPQEGGEVHNHIDKAVFVGSTAELSELMKQKKIEAALDAESRQEE
jgi:hypothetical protein